MPFVEDLSAFFPDHGFGTVELAWTPSAGGPEVVERVIFDEETVEVLGGAQLSDEPSILFRSAGALAALATGETVTISAVDYRVREVKKIEDGALTRASLSKP